MKPIQFRGKETMSYNKTEPQMNSHPDEIKWNGVDYVKKDFVNQEVEKRIAEIDQHGRIAVSVIKKKLWSMRFNEDDVKRETDGRRKRFIYGYTEAINDIAQWLTDTVSQNTRSRLTNLGVNDSQKTEGGKG